MQPKLIAFDFETTGLNFWEPDFRVLSAAFAWFREDGSIGTRYLEGEDEIGEQLKLIADSDEISIAAHNAAFEFGVSKFRFGYMDRVSILDTMRLVQLYDNGGSRAKLQGPLSLEDEMAMLEGTLKVSSGLGLEAAVSRILPKEFHNHKEPYYKWLRDNGVKKGQEGANLQRLPPEMLEAYNTMDAIVTLLLHKEITDKFAAEGFDWTFDHKLHFEAIKRIVASKAKGIKVDIPVLCANESKLNHDIGVTRQKFFSVFAKPICDIENDRLTAWVDAPKTARGKQNRAAQPIPDSIRFNAGSTHQLKELFVDTLGHKPVFWTKEAKARKDNPDRKAFVPQPSMRAAHLPSYGHGGEMLQNVKKKQLVAMQMAKLLDKSATDGRFHHDLNVCGTKTSRYTGGGGLNIQAMARRDKDLMSCMIADDGMTLVSIDLAAGEPVVIAHYSQDKNYRAAAFDMVGVQPYWSNDVLMIDDPYLMYSSISPIGSKVIRDAWEEGLFETWLLDAESIKSKLKKTRALHKTLFLALCYGQGPKGMVNFLADQGYPIEFKTAKDLHFKFWHQLYPDVRKLDERLQCQFQKQGFLVNEFGYRMKPDNERLCFNMMIQSSVSGIMKVFETMLLDLAPYAQYQVTIHDESIVQVPDDKLEQFKTDTLKATDMLNNYLGWSVNIRTGFAPGKDYYSAK